MKNFVVGVFVTLVVLVLVGAAFTLLGWMPTNADAGPPAYERRIASTALDASMERHAPRVDNPVPATPQNLIDGMKIYTMNCALCHGGLDQKPNLVGAAQYPPAPDLILDPLDDPEWHIFYAVRTGVRYTGMPAWGKVLSEDEIWKVTGFLSHLDKLPPEVKDAWQKSFGVPPPEPSEHHHEHDEH